MKIMPSARTRNLVTQDVKSEVLLYDLDTHKSFCLNETSALVWKNCDGKTPISQFAANLKLPEQIVLLALEQLGKECLLAEEFDAGLPADQLSRRRMLGALGTAVALPIIWTLVAPRSVQAQSNGQCILNGGEFCVPDPNASAETCTNIFANAEVSPSVCCSNLFIRLVFRDNPLQCCGVCGVLD